MGRRRARSLRWLGLGLAGVGGAALGSLLVQSLLQMEPSHSDWYVERSFDFGRYGSGASITRDGWSDDDEQVTWMSAARASLEIPIQKESDDLVVILKGVVPKSAQAAVFELYADRTLLQEWSSSPGSATFARAFRIPPGAIRSMTVPLELHSPREAKLGLTSVELIEFKEMSSFKGVVDSCSKDGVLGWAAIDGMAGSVSVLLDDQPAQGRLVSTERPDLPAAQLPSDAGFRFTFAKPVAPGTAIKVLMANGRRASKSPCTVR